jgi:hypothetical protein
MVKDEVFEQAWPGHNAVPHGRAILCVGCLEQRIGRTLTRADFTDVPVNDIFDNDFKSFSDRLLNRLCADVETPDGTPALHMEGLTLRTEVSLSLRRTCSHWLIGIARDP